MNGVMVERRTLRGLRSLVAGVIVSVLVLVAAVALVVREDQQSCKAGNDFRTRDLPAAFRLHDQHLGRAFQADTATVDEFSDDFEAALADLFPEEDCSLL